MEQSDRHEKSVDLDVTPEGPYADQRPYPPKKKPVYGPIWIGIGVVAVIIIITFFAFSGDKPTDPAETPAAAPPSAAGSGDASEPALPEKAPDAVSFSPSPEMRAEEESATSQNMVAATSASVPAVEPDQDSVEEKAAEEKIAAEKKAAEKKAAEKKAAEKKAAEAKAAEAKGDEAEPAELAEAGTKPASEVKAEADKPAEAVAISDQWVVNISSTPDAAESLKVLSQVMSRKAPGEAIYAYEATINGVLHHRIRIGFFATRAEAEAVGQRVKEELKLSATPWAVQPNVDEVTKYKK